MHKNYMRAILDRGEPSIGTRVWSTWPFITEVIGENGKYDYIEFTAEYTPCTQLDMENICRAAELYKMGTVIKVDLQNRAFIAQKAIAAGFNALLLADHKTADEVKESLWYIRADDETGQGRFGKPCRRFNLDGTGFLGTEAYAKKLKETVVMVMIEKKEAVENLEDILRVPGVDMVQWGPADYSLNMGWERSDKSAELRETEKYVIETALKMGVAPRCEIATAEAAEYYQALGVKHFCLGDEVMNNLRWWNSEGSKLRNLIANDGFICENINKESGNFVY